MRAVVVILAILVATCCAQVIVSTNEIIQAVPGGIFSQADSVVTSTGHILTAAVDPFGHLVAVYCVDMACKTTMSTVLTPSLRVTDPDVEQDPSSPDTPIILFHHSDRTVLGFIRCSDPSCRVVSSRHDVAFTTDPRITFEGGVSGVLDKSGGLSAVYRRTLLGAGFSQAVLLQCTQLEPPQCVTNVLSTGSNEAPNIAPHQMTLSSNQPIVAYASTPTSPTVQLIKVAICPGLPTLCVVHIEKILEANPSEPLGMFSLTAATCNGFPCFLYSSGADASTATLHFVTCPDLSCSVPNVAVLTSLPPYSSLGRTNVPFPLLSSASSAALFRIHCSDAQCSQRTAAFLAPPQSAWAVPPVNALSSPSSGLLWGTAVAYASGSTVVVTELDMTRVALCSGQGAQYLGCKGAHESCAAQNSSVALEGTCQCVEGTTQSVDGITPYGCCGGCNTTDRSCVGGLCVCINGLVAQDGYSYKRDGYDLICSVATAATTPTTAAPPTTAPPTDPPLVNTGAVVGAVFGALIGVTLAGFVAFLLYRCYTRRQRTLYGADDVYRPSQPFIQVASGPASGAYVESAALMPPTLVQPQTRKGPGMHKEDDVSQSWMHASVTADQEEDADDRDGGAGVYDFM